MGLSASITKGGHGSEVAKHLDKLRKRMWVKKTHFILDTNPEIAKHIPKASEHVERVEMRPEDKEVALEIGECISEGLQDVKATF